MKVLFTDRRDQTLFCLEATSALYSPKMQELLFEGDGNEVTITGIAEEHANNIILNFFEKDRLDLRLLAAYVNENPFYGAGEE